MPRLPATWKSYRICYVYRKTVYQISIFNAAGDWRGPQQVVVDGQSQPEAAVPLVDDGKEHQVEVRFG